MQPSSKEYLNHFNVTGSLMAVKIVIKSLFDMDQWSELITYQDNHTVNTDLLYLLGFP